MSALDDPGLQRRFADIDRANPNVWSLFVRLTFDRIHRGFRNYSSDAVLHRVRWETAVPLEDGSGFKINNNWSPFYARKFHDAYPQHAGFFRTRASVADAGRVHPSVSTPQYPRH
jgi:hypothetical protein